MVEEVSFSKDVKLEREGRVCIWNKLICQGTQMFIDEHGDMTLWKDRKYLRSFPSAVILDYVLSDFDKWVDLPCNEPPDEE
jgi:hypothetical protein